jgi:YD repeat-containing protein
MERYNLTHAYDVLNRLTSTTGDQGYKEHKYAYDSLGNLTYETIGNSKSVDYKYNNLNQLVNRIDNGKDNFSYTYDKRGNQIKEVYNKNLKKPEQDEIIASYVYDSTNRMVKGINAKGEQSFYIYNGLGHLVGNEWIIAKNAYGYTDINAAPSVQVNSLVVCDRHSNIAGDGHIDPNGKGHTACGADNGIAPVIDNKKF